jgi:hypothetical protein
MHLLRLWLTQAESHESFCKHHEVGRTIAKDSAKHKVRTM